MEQNTKGKMAGSRLRLNMRWLSVMLGVLVILTLLSAVVLAQSGDEYSGRRAPRGGANPSMDVASWYAPINANGALLASRALSRDANPSMDVASWYAPISADGALLASRALLDGANPSMNVAQWYAPVEVNGALIASRSLNPGANPSMNVALWYASPQSDFEALLCLAEGAGEICQ